MNLLILGAGGHGRVVRETAQATGLFEKIAFLDDAAEDALGKLEEFPRFLEEFDCAFVAMGNPRLRREYQTRLESHGVRLPTLIHPRSAVSPTAKVAPGTVIMAGAVVQTNAMIGGGCILSAGAIIDHDARLGDYCHINAGAIVPSMAVVPENTKVDYGQIFRAAEK